MAIMPPVIMKSVMHYSITYALHSFLENASQKWRRHAEICRGEDRYCGDFTKGKKALGGDVSPPNKELTILLVIGVAGRFQLLCGSLRFFYFTFICQLQRVVNLTDQNIETVTEVFHFRAVR